jgi:cell division transport system permease protein
MIWLRLQLRAGLRAARQMARQPFNTLLAALVVGIAAALPATGYMLLGNLQRLAGNVSAAPEISVFMQATANADAVRTADQRIRALAKEAKVELVSRDAALKRFRDNEALAEILDALPDNPFADAFVVRLDTADAARLETAPPLRARKKNTPISQTLSPPKKGGFTLCKKRKGRCQDFITRRRL